jgi:spore germination protein YaaH
MAEIGMVYDTMQSTARAVGDTADTLDTIMSICDGAVVALGVASAIPGAAAATGPVISVYESIRPTLSTVIDVCQAVDDYMLRAVQVVQNADDICQGKWQQVSNLPLMPTDYNF